MSQPNDQLASALQSQYALVSASPVAEQFAQLSAIVADSQTTVQKRGGVLALVEVIYAAVYIMIAIRLLAEYAKLSSGVYVSSPGSMMQDLAGSPSVIVANVNGEELSVTLSSQAPTATAIASATSASSASSAISSSTTPWPCAGTSCRSSNDLVTATPYTCNLPGKSGDACALVYTDMYSYNISGTSYPLGIASLTSALASFGTMAPDPFTTMAPTACQ